jgi:hypothetical protein
MTQGKPILDRNFGKRVIRVALGILGLLILRAILGALPMVKHATAIGDSFLTPLVLAQAIVDTVIFVLILRFGVGLGRAIEASYTRLPDLGKIISLATVALVLVLAYNSYQTVTACLVESPADMLKTTLSAPLGSPSGIDETTRQMIDGIRGTNLEAILHGLKTLDSSFLVGYQQMAVLALRHSPDIYGWTFLILVAIPVVFIVVLVSRNLDALTEMVLRAATISPKPVAGEGARYSGLGPVGGASPRDAIEKLSKLRALLDSGVISREDFEGQKAALLRGLQTGSEPGELRKLKALVDFGTLTPQEFEVQKQRFLAGL